MKTFGVHPLIVIALAAPSALAAPAFHVEVTGRGKTMILIPGLASSGSTWNSTVQHYAGRYECHVLTLAGFAGHPPLAVKEDEPFLDTMREAISSYIREKKLEKPVIAGHSLGGFLALSLAARYPDLTGPLVIVDSYPFLTAIFSPGATAESARKLAENMRTSAGGPPTREMMANMARSSRDVDQILAWGQASDGATVAKAMYEMTVTDLRPRLGAIRVPALVLGSWAGYAAYTNRETTLGNLTRQYAGLSGVRIELHDETRHFIMFDEPEWMFAQMDRFLGK